MAPSRIMFIRHAEKPHKPPCENDDGVKKSGENDEESLTVQGWQRAGALVHFFASQQPLKPQTIFAAGVGHKSLSHRPKQTVTPLATWLNVAINESDLKDDIQGLADDVMKQTGTVLVCWEHELIADIIARLPNPPKVPQDWPPTRFDIVWVLDADGAGWKFSQIPQMLLAGDISNPIT
jgi:broad specificity phosphatase PhoE